MSGDLLQTKLFVPPLRPSQVPRPRLTQRLEQGVRSGAKLTLVSAPAGFGKSTLISEWIQQLGSLSDMDGPGALDEQTKDTPFPRLATWLSLDQGDNETVRFFAYFVAALQKVDSGIGETAKKALDSPGTPALEPILTSLVNDITRSASPFILVLDDYHAITAVEIHEALDFLLACNLPAMHLVVVTRQDPALSLSRLRGHGLVTEFRQSDLRFSTEEVSLFLSESMGLKLADSEKIILETRTEGWIVGLQLAALAMRGRRDEEEDATASIADFVKGFSGRLHFILDYLTDEVLDSQPREVQRFLLQSSILERMSGSLCDFVVMGDQQLAGSEPLSHVDDGIDRSLESSQAILEYLDHSNLFLVPLDSERRWYRYHHLFSELLRARLQELAQDELVAALHRRAAQWHERHGPASAAVKHALKSADFEWAADVIERIIRHPTTWSTIDNSSYLAWLNVLPGPIAQSRPWLRLFASRAHFINGKGKAAQTMLDELERWLKRNLEHPDSNKVMELVIGDQASYAAVLGEVSSAKRYARRALTQLDDDDHAAHIRPAAILGLAAIRAGDLEEAYGAFSQAYRATLAVGDSARFAAVPLACNLADVQIARGQLSSAVELCERALELGTVDGKRIPTAGFVDLALGRILYERNGLHKAEEHLLKGLELLALGGISDGFSYMKATLARVKQAQGESDSALDIIEEVIRAAETSNIQRLIILTEAYRARISLAAGHLEEATHWARDYEKVGDTEYLREFEELTLARVLLAEGKLDELSSKLQSLLRDAEPAGRMASVMEIHILDALARAESGEAEAAIVLMHRAMALAEPEGYVRIFIDEGRPMARLLYATSQHEAGSLYASKLLEAFSSEASQSSVLLAPSSGEPSPQLLKPDMLIDPLTKRELDVLRHLAAGLTNREIGRRLFVSPNTVRTHSYNLYSKLGVHNRMSAVARARELGLIPGS